MDMLLDKLTGTMRSPLPSFEKKILTKLVAVLILMEVAETNAEIKGYFQCTQPPKAVKCLKGDLPKVENGYFNCSGYSVGRKCILTCDKGYFAPSSKETICEELDDFESNWTLGDFECSKIKCSEGSLPKVMDGIFMCPAHPDVSKGDMCVLSCQDPFYPSQSKQAICGAGKGDTGGEWTSGNFSCATIDCNEWNLWSGSTYKWIEAYLSWDYAHALCRNIGAHLVNIADQEENDFVHMMMSHCIQPNQLYSWIGLSDLEKNDMWEWSNGENSYFRNWDQRYPIQPENRATEDYGGMGKELGKWHDFRIFDILPAVCERNK